MVDLIRPELVIVHCSIYYILYLAFSSYRVWYAPPMQLFSEGSRPLSMLLCLVTSSSPTDYSLTFLW